MQKKLHTILVAVSLIGLASALRWLYGATNGFNRGISLYSLANMLLLFMPLALAVFISAIYIARKRTNKEGSISRPFVIVACLVIIPLSAVVVFHPRVRTEPIGDFIHSDTLRPTDDGLFEYRLDLINLFQRNARARLFVRDLTTGEEMYIPLRISVRGVGVISTPGGNFLRARMVQGELDGQYILRIPAGAPHRRTLIDGRVFEFARIGDIQATFLIDIPNATATRIE